MKFKLIFLTAALILLSSCSKTKVDSNQQNYTGNDNKALSEINYNKKCIDKYKVDNPKNILEDYKNIAINYALENKLNFSDKDIVIKYLGNQEIVYFYDFLQECKGEGPNIFTHLTFETKDVIQRRVYINPHDKNEFKHSLSKYSDFNFDEKNIFYDLVGTDSIKQTLSNSKIDTSTVPELAKSYSSTATGSNFRKLNVLQSSLEAHNVIFAGVSTVLNGIINGQIDHVDSLLREDINPLEITPFYDILKRENQGNYKLVGYLRHYIDGQFYISTIYKTSKPSKINQFLVQPDPDFKHHGLFDIGEIGNLYNKIMHSNAPVALGYYTSAVAAFASLYHGGEGKETIDVLHSHSHQAALANVLINRFYSSLRRNASLPKVSTVYTVHASTCDFGVFRSNFLTRLVLEKDLPKAPIISFHIMSLLESDIVNSVSKGVIDSYISSNSKLGFEINNIYNHLLRIKRLHGIPNGINFEDYDPRNKNVLGDLTVNSDLSDLTDKKNHAKKALFEAGIISSPTKPLYMYVGRMVEEKGVDHFQSFAEYITKNNGQIVIMGPVLDLKTIPPLIDSIKKLNNDNIRVYTDKKFQSEILPSLKLKKGTVIRFASDFTFIPSKREPFGLVALEALIFGSNIITSNAEGLKDITLPYDPISNNINDFNSVIYKMNIDNTSDSISNMLNALEQFNVIWNSFTPQQKENAQKRAIMHVEKFKWNAKDGSNDQYKALYLKAITPLNELEKKTHNEFLNNYFNYGYHETL